MKKTTHQILYVILFSAVGIVLSLQFSRTEPSLEIKETSQNTLNNTIDSLNILKVAYVNSDTVSKYYKFAIKIQKDLTKKRSEAEKQIKNKYYAYERLVKDYEKAAPIMGDREKMEKAQNIRLLEQEIMQVEQQLSSKVSKEELKITQDYIIKTNDFMQVIGQR